MTKFYFGILLFLILCDSPDARPAYNSEQKFEVVQLQEDFLVLKEILQNVHGDPYRYTPSKTMDSLLDATYLQLVNPLTEIEFFRLINPILIAVRDEHTFALPSSQFFDKVIGQTVYTGRSLESSMKLFPFFIKVADNQVFIDNNLSSDMTLKTGDEILSINDQPASEVIQKLLPTIPTNGYIETFRVRHLEQFSLGQTYNRFMVHYALFIGTPDFFSLKIKKGVSGKIQTIRTEALTSSKMFNNYWRRYSTVNDPKKRRENPLEFSIPQDKTGYLRLSDFHSPVWARYNYSHSTEFRNIFELISNQRIRSLIVDLRDNEGGNLAIGVELLKYLCTSPFQPYLYHEVKGLKFPQFKKYFRDSTALANYPAELFSATDKQTFRSNPNYKTETMSRPMQPSPTAYQHKLYVMINGATGSAASILATLIKVNRPDAIFIGEESGGDMEGPVSGSGTDINLPNTKIRVDVPHVRRFVNLNGYDNKKGRGVIPDYRVKTSPNDLTRQIDTELEFTLKLIRAKR